MRLTRAQRRAGADATTDIHLDPETDTETQKANAEPIGTPSKAGRAPLTEVTVNQVEETQEDGKPMPAKKGKKTGAKGKGKGRGRKAKKDEPEEEDNEEQVDLAQDNTPEVDSPVVVEDLREAAMSPASDAADEQLKQSIPADDITPEPVHNERPQSPAVRLTRRQLAIAAAEAALTGARSLPSESNEPIDTPQDAAEPTIESPSSEEKSDPEPEPEALRALEAITQVEEPEEILKSPQSMKATLMSSLETVARQESAVKETSRSPARSPKVETPIEALDALEDALDEINQAIPIVSPGKTKSAPRVRINGHTPNTSESSIEQPVATQKVSRPPRQVKSIKENTAGKAALRNKINFGLKRSASTKASAASSREASAQAKPKSHEEIVDYLASKRRPVSVSFPTPPPVQKSAKALTKSTFALPGEAVAAKLKAQREARLAREAAKEDGQADKKSQPIKSRLAPKKVTIVAAPACAAKPTAASRARESHVGSPALAEKSDRQTQRTSTIAMNNGKRQPTLVRGTKPRPISLHAPQNLPGVSIPSPPTQAESKPAPKPRITSMTIQTKPRESKPVPVVKSVVTATDVETQKLKGKEIFNRDKIEKEERERERREKEEAAKKARAEAAERGRLASREWAEKQKKRLMEKMAAQATA